MTKETDEINILDVLKRIFSFIGNTFSRLIQFIKKNLLLFFIVSVLGAGSGFGYFKNAKPVYSSDIIVLSNYLSNEYCFELIAGLQNYVRDNTPEILAEKLKISKETAEKIVKIQCYNFLDREKNDADTVVHLGIPFRISVYALDNRIYDSLQPAIMDYFERNPYVTEQRDIRLNNTRLLVDKVRKEQVSLDTLKKTIAQHLVPRGTQNGFVFGQPLDPLNVYREGMTLYKDEIAYNTDILIYSKNLRLVRPFEVREKPYSPRLFLSLLYGGILGLIAGFAIALVRDARRK